MLSPRFGQQRYRSVEVIEVPILHILCVCTLGSVYKYFLTNAGLNAIPHRQQNNRWLLYWMRRSAGASTRFPLPLSLSIQVTALIRFRRDNGTSFWGTTFIIMLLLNLEFTSLKNKWIILSHRHHVIFLLLSSVRLY